MTDEEKQVLLDYIEYEGGLDILLEYGFSTIKDETFQMLRKNYADSKIELESYLQGE